MIVRSAVVGRTAGRRAVDPMSHIATAFMLTMAAAVGEAVPTS